jgi:hypothetical protein
VVALRNDHLITVALRAAALDSTIATLSWLAASISTTTEYACPSITLLTTVTHRTPTGALFAPVCVCLTIQNPDNPALPVANCSTSAGAFPKSDDVKGWSGDAFIEGGPGFSPPCVRERVVPMKRSAEGQGCYYEAAPWALP